MKISQHYVCKWKISEVNKSKITRSDEFNKSFSNRKNKAKENFDAITTMETKQELLETVIKSQGGYKDALVRADGTDIKVTVKAAKHSQKEANKIIQLVRSEGGSKDVGVKLIHQQNKTNNPWGNPPRIIRFKTRIV